MGQNNSAIQDIFLTIYSGQTHTLQLYDYTSNKNRIISKDKILSNSSISHDGQNIAYGPSNKIDKSLFNIKLTNQGIELERTKENKSVLWRVLKQSQLYPLSIGNQLKLGKLKLTLKQIVYEEKQITQRDQQQKNQLIQCLQFQDIKSISSCSQQSYKQKQCRICYESSSTSVNPLVSLCKCVGSVKFVHFECLKDWVSKFIQSRKSNNSIYYSYQQTKCQLCHYYYAPNFHFEGRPYSLLNLNQSPKIPYATFQGVQYQQQVKRYILFYIGLGDEEIMIGRNSNSHVIMKEISVSRSHCTLLYKGKQLFIKDKGSKFGTLIKVQNQIQFNPAQGICLQYQSKLFTLQQQKQLSCCCVSNDCRILRITQQQEVIDNKSQKLSQNF